LLASDELIYNNDTGVVIATGGVQIDYGSYKLVADRVEYDQTTGRMRAIGSVEMIEPNGNVIFADELDVTDDFADGFVNALRIETPDNTRIAAESAERSGGVETTFNNGVYTACEPCKENPERAPFWQVKAQRVIQNGETRTIRLERATFELFGMPIAYLPYLEVPDHTLKRKTGFLAPSFRTSDNLGYGVSVPFYVSISPYMDATFTGTGYTKAGLSRRSRIPAEIRQWRAHAAHGRHFADQARGIRREHIGLDRNRSWHDRLKGQVPDQSALDFRLGRDGADRQQFLTHLRHRGLRFEHGQIRDLPHRHLEPQLFRSAHLPFRHSGRRPGEHGRKRQQAVVHPSLDYQRTFSDPVAGGELALNVNGYSLSRKANDITVRPGLAAIDPLNADRYNGFSGDNARISAELEWKRTFTAMNGLRLTPILAARGDLNSVDIDTAPDRLQRHFRGQRIACPWHDHCRA
jgi:LPS-assembly protein